jgi:hypothetical protein
MSPGSQAQFNVTISDDVSFGYAFSSAGDLDLNIAATGLEVKFDVSNLVLDAGATAVNVTVSANTAADAMIADNYIAPTFSSDDSIVIQIPKASLPNINSAMDQRLGSITVILQPDGDDAMGASTSYDVDNFSFDLY